MKKRIRNCLEALPYGLGPRFFIPTARLALSLTPTRFKGRLDRKNKLREEMIEAKRIIRSIASDEIRRAMIVFDNLVSPPTYGDYIYVVMLARYFIKRNIPVNFVIVDGEYRSDWSPLNESEKQRFVSDLVAIAEVLLDSSTTRIEVVRSQELESRLGNSTYARCFIPLGERVNGRVNIYSLCFNILNHLMSEADKDLRDRFLLSFHEIASKVKFESPALPYVTWHCRYSEKWGENRNTDDEKFLQICDKLKSLYPKHAIMVVSDEIGCNHFRALAYSHGLGCIFSKDYSRTFIGDGALVLGSDFYYQFWGGGVCVFPFFGKVPYEMHVPMGHEIEWEKGKASPWATEKQMFVNIRWDDESLFLPTGSVKI
jgi:hypothetical protein